MTTKPNALVVSAADAAEIADQMTDREEQLFDGGLVSWGSHPEHGGLVMVELEGVPALVFQMADH